MARNDPQVNIRLPVALKTLLETAAEKNNRSFKAEIEFRLDGWDQVMDQLDLTHEGWEQARAKNAAQKEQIEALQREVDSLKDQNELLTQTIAEASVLEMRRAEEQGLGSMIQALQMQMNSLESDRSALIEDQKKIIAQQAGLIENLENSIKSAGSLILSFREAFSAAAQGDESVLRQLVLQLADRDDRSTSKPTVGISDNERS